MELNELSIKMANNCKKTADIESFIISSKAHDVLQVIVDGNDEPPVNVTNTADQVLSISNLICEDKIIPELKVELDSLLMQFNVPIPLSTLTKNDDKYAISGGLSKVSPFQQIEHKIVTLAANSADALQDVSHYLSDSN